MGKGDRVGGMEEIGELSDEDGIDGFSGDAVSVGLGRVGQSEYFERVEEECRLMREIN